MSLKSLFKGLNVVAELELGDLIDWLLTVDILIELLNASSPSSCGCWLKTKKYIRQKTSSVLTDKWTKGKVPVIILKFNTVFNWNL